MSVKWEECQELIDKYEEWYRKSANGKLGNNTSSSCFTKLTDSDKVGELFFALDGMAKKMATRGIPKPYILQLRLVDWKQILNIHLFLKYWKYLGH